jgi:predicted NAD/FAD-binding protein
MPPPPPGTVAVIGGGAAGIAAAHLLQGRHRVTLFEKGPRLGGHVHTVEVPSGPDAGTRVDMGFIVLNDRTYPTLHRLLADLGVAWRWSDMSFAYHDETSGFHYAGTTLNGLFSRRRNLFSPAFWSMLWEIRRFSRSALEDLRGRRDLETVTMGAYLQEGGYSAPFRERYLLPMGAAIWSAAPGRILEFPAAAFMRFFRNHGLLSLRDRPRWQTVAGGSRSYVDAFLRRFAGTVRTACRVEALLREEGGVRVRFGGTEERFDHAVVATHADEALALLADPSEEERRLLGAWRYSRNLTILHTDASVLPRARSAWASWNYARERGAAPGDPVSLTYHMNRLQGLRTREEYLVTLNRRAAVAPDRVIESVEFAHPLYTREAVATQALLPGLNGTRRTWFCGAYFHNGFHEDAVRSGVEAARSLGAAW